MKINLYQSVEILEQEAVRIALWVLETKIIRDQWIESSFIMEEHFTSHPFDARVGNVHDNRDRFEILRAALAIRDYLKGIQTDGKSN